MTFPQPKPVSFSETLAAFDSVPLFMKSIPTDPNDSKDDIALQALQSLVHEGTPDEVARNFKEQGNDYFKGKRYREALGFYCQGVDAKPTVPVLQEALLCNRAACNLELQNYGSVLRDCSEAIKVNPKSSKAYFRSASALLALERVEEALDCCDFCLAFDSANQTIKSVRDKAMAMKIKKDRKEQERIEKIRKELEENAMLKTAFEERNLITLTSPRSIEDNPYIPHFDENPAQNKLIFPVFFLYPQYAISDIISHFVEDTHFSAHLALMFPPDTAFPDWDKNKEYTRDTLNVYAMTHRKRLLRIGKSMTLRDVIDAGAKVKKGEPKDGLELKDGCFTFAVLPKGGVEQKWIDEYKKARDG